MTQEQKWESYFYPKNETDGQNVLVNKLGIRDAGELDEAERLPSGAGQCEHEYRKYARR